MKSLEKRALLFVFFVAQSSNAWAYDFGFVRAPDWMDQYVLLVFLLVVVFWAASYLTKPEDVPFSELRRTKKEPLNRFFFVTLQVLGLCFIALVFVGMTLARM